MSERGEKARALFLQGYTCAQAVVGAWADELGLDMDTAMRIASPFGGGMGRLREVCGAVSGMLIVAGLQYGYSDPKDREAKKRTYRMVQELAGKYREANGSIVCRELLGLEGKDCSPVPSERTAEYYKKRPCPSLVECAAEILEAYRPETEDRDETGGAEK